MAVGAPIAARIAATSPRKARASTAACSPRGRRAIGR
jgi:hypothetical protein